MRIWISMALGMAVAGCSGNSDDDFPDTFGDCGASVCTVSLSAFTQNPGGIPHCEGTLAEALAMPCTSPSNLEGSCDGLRVLKHVYGFPGDNYACVYDEASGALVGASWATDSHPLQVAGASPPASCALAELLCTDGGSP